MIKINLLPKSIYQKRAVRRTAMLFAVILVAVIAAGITYSIKLSADVRDMEQQAADAEAWEARVKEIQGQVQAVKTSTEPIKWKLDRINEVLQYNTQYPKLYEEIAKWTYEKVTYTSMQCNGTQVGMTARVKTLDDLGRYLLNMYRATHLFTKVDISGIPGYPKQTSGATGAPGPPPVSGAAGEPGGAPPTGAPGSSIAGLGTISESLAARPVGEDWIEFQVSGVLRTPIVAPSFETGAAGEAGAGGQPGAAPQTGAPPGTGPPPEAVPPPGAGPPAAAPG